MWFIFGAATTVTTADSRIPDPEKLRGGYYTPAEISKLALQVGYSKDNRPGS